jgi:hypothetical protein
MSNPTNKILIQGMIKAGNGGHTKPSPTPLSTPIPVSPVNNQHFPPYPRKLTLTWQPVTGATEYSATLQFLCTTAQGKTWLTKPAISATTTTLAVDFPANVPGRWSVKAIDSTGAHTPSPDSAWSTFDFTVQILDTPTLVSPPNGQVFNHYPRNTTLAWNPVPNATGYVVQVDACQDRQICPNSIWQTVQKLIIQTTAFTFNFNGAQPGRWCVFAIDSTDAHQQSTPSAWSIFTYTI